MVNIMGDSVGEGVDVTMVHAAGEVSLDLTIDMNILSVVEVGVILNRTSLTTEEEAKNRCFEDDENNGMVMIQTIVIEITGIEIEIIKVMLTEVGDGMVIEVKGIVIGEGDNAGTLIPIINNRDTLNNPNTKILIIIVHLQWAININISCPMNNIQSVLKNNNNTCHKDCQHNHIKLQTYVSYVRIKAIMIISANL